MSPSAVESCPRRGIFGDRGTKGSLISSAVRRRTGEYPPGRLLLPGGLCCRCGPLTWARATMYLRLPGNAPINIAGDTGCRHYGTPRISKYDTLPGKTFKGFLKCRNRRGGVTLRQSELLGQRNRPKVASTVAWRTDSEHPPARLLLPGEECRRCRTIAFDQCGCCQTPDNSPSVKLGRRMGLPVRRLNSDPRSTVLRPFTPFN